MPVSPDELSELRQQIDGIDSQLVKLLAQRAEITAKVGQYKSQVGLPIYVPEREAQLIAKRRAEAEQQNVSPVLVEDLLRRIMRESYHTQNVDYLCTNPQIKKIVEELQPIHDKVAGKKVVKFGVIMGLLSVPGVNVVVGAALVAKLIYTSSELSSGQLDKIDLSRFGFNRT
jgi:chorismate mutase-like protein